MTKRNIKGNKVHDPALVAGLQYNESAGAQKQVDVGPKLLALPNGATSTTDATTRVSLPSKGRNVAIYNTSATLYAVTFGDGTVTALAAGVVSGNNVGIPCTPNQWTHLAAGDATFVITQNAALLVFLIEDDTSLNQQSTR